MHSPTRRLAFLALFVAAATNADAALDLRNASVQRLDNGLTLILLEDRRFPVVSVQMLYRVGARDEVTGKTGLAHFLEHMAFRASDRFPDTELVSRIYAIGGEWHGYTWIDQTTYFATVPKEHLPLLLEIEADRMSSLTLDPADVEAERGAVLSEMHMYENDPASILVDAANFASFLAHPYRNNTIGWQSDIEHLKHEDVVAFYRQHYHPANAVLAIVGDFDAVGVREKVDTLFGKLPGKPATPLPHTREPEQSGERRITLHGDAGPPQFLVAYRAPSANHRDFAAFLVLQEILGTGSGVNFLQNDWGTPVGEQAPLADAADAVTTWYPPSAQDYVFTIGGRAPGTTDPPEVEARLESALAAFRDTPPDESLLLEARSEVLDQLVFDVETTEDAAHQLAFFDGLGALDTLLELPQRVAAVSAADVQRVARTWLAPEKRTIAWYLPGAPQPVDGEAPQDSATAPAPRPGPSDDGGSPLPAPVVTRLAGGVPAIVQPSDLSSSAHLQVVLAAPGADGSGPVRGRRSLSFQVRVDGLAGAMAEARRALSDTATEVAAYSSDPETRLEQAFQDVMRTAMPARDPAVELVVVAGNVEPAAVIDLLEDGFGQLRPPEPLDIPAPTFDPAGLDLHLGREIAQAWLGYIVPAPPPGDPASDAWRLLLYVVSHDYEGRLGKNAISRRGLVYYIGSEYRSDGRNAWITLATGVDPGKVAAMRTLLEEEFARLADDPPTIEEIDEAKRHLVGRRTSAAQSNAELASLLAIEWLWYGELLSAERVASRLERITRHQVIDAIGPFTKGKTIVVAE